MSYLQWMIERLDVSAETKQQYSNSVKEAHATSRSVAQQLRTGVATEEERIALLLQCFDSEPNQYGIRTMNAARVEAARKHLGFSLPSPETAAVLGQLRAGRRTVLEIGCGAGLYARVFGERWIATDMPSKHQEWVSMEPLHAPIHLTDDPLALLRDVPPEDQILLAVWPEAESTYLEKYTSEFKGRFIVIIGQPGVTASESIWDLLDARAEYTSHEVCTQKLMCNLNVYESVHVWDTAAKKQ